MKKCFAWIMAFVLTMSLCGCKRGSHDVYEEIYERYYDMKSFSAVAEVTVVNERTENSYEIKQSYLAPDCFSLEVLKPEKIAGSGFVSSEGETFFKSGFGQGERIKNNFADKRGCFFVSDFFEDYFKSEETAVKVDSVKGEAVTVLECFMNWGEKEKFLQKLWIDNETFLPVRFETFDVNNQPQVLVVFSEFSRDCGIDKSEFE